MTLWTADCVTGVPMDRSETAPHSTSHSKLYANLGVPPGASTEAIRRAYSVLEDTYRPGGAYVDDVMHLAFTEISRAASILGDPKTRKLYDQGYIDDFGKPTKAGLARTLRVRTAVLSCGALFAIGLAGLAIFTVESQNRRSGPVESATDANSVQHSSQLSPPPAADQTLKSVSNDKPASHGSDGAAPYRPERETILRRKQRMGPKILPVLLLRNGHEHRKRLPFLRLRKTEPSKTRRRSPASKELAIRNCDGMLACQGQGREWCSPTYGSARRLPLHGRFAPRKRLKQRIASPVSRTIGPIAPGLANDENQGLGCRMESC